jgi:chromate reductase, NAD(P)H dehydrogenase (quinone)
MIYTIISGTNRVGSHTRKAAELYHDLLRTRDINAPLVLLDEMTVTRSDSGFQQVERDILIPATKIIIVSPEYNGSYPGILKMLIDVSDIRNTWWGKKILLTGISSGRAGNLRGMEHLTGVLQYMKCFVHPNKLPISSVDKLTDDNGRIVDRATLAVIEQQLDEFISF